MSNFSSRGTLGEFQKTIEKIYGVNNDRLYSISDMVANQEKFTMRALKGIRKGDTEKMKNNLLIAFSWMISLANRLQIDLEDMVWKRFPAVCSYCGNSPCVCRSMKPGKRAVIKIDGSRKPKSLKETQEMFARVYPAEGRTLSEAGVHLAEEMGEINEAIHTFFGEHKEEQFGFIQEELADYISCVFGVANSAGFNFGQELAELFGNNCHVCHQSPCECTFSFVAGYRS